MTDPEHESMLALWKEIAEQFQYPREAKRTDIYTLVDSSETGALEWFGQMHEVDSSETWSQGWFGQTDDLTPSR